MSSVLPAAGSSSDLGGSAGSGNVTLPIGGGRGEAGGNAGGTPNESTAGAAGAAGGASEDCDSVAADQLAGTWTTNCNGYVCGISITEAGLYGGGCTNGQFETGTLVDGNLETTGEGGPYAPYSTKGAFTRIDCSALKRDYVGQIPPHTGPEMPYSCQLQRTPDCGSTLLEALAGVWDGTCGDSSKCTSTILADGSLSSTCTNGQHSTGTVEATGAYSDTGGGGGFPDFSTSGVLGLTTCDAFVMPYTWQMPPHQGQKTSAECSYVRHVEQP
jgi:hypothetical protein